MQTGNRWGLPEGYQVVTPREAPAVPTIRTVVDDTAVKAANKTVEVLEKVMNDQRVELEKLKRENQTLHSQVLNSNAKVHTLEESLRASNAIMNSNTDAFANRKASRPELVGYAKGGFTGQSEICPEVYAPAFTADSYKLSQALAVATSYVAPINPMTLFVEFLEELDVLEEYVKIIQEQGVSFELLCSQYEPSDWISRVCTDDDEDYLDGWDDADKIWLNMCEADALDEKESYIE